MPGRKGLSMAYTLYTSLLAGSLFIGMLILLEVGRRKGGAL